MKRLLLLAFVITVTNLYAQEFQPDINKLIAHSKVSSFKKDTSKPTPRQPLALDLKLLTPKVLKLQPGTHALPQDGMPCIVPDTKKQSSHTQCCEGRSDSSCKSYTECCF